MVDQPEKDYLNFNYHGGQSSISDDPNKLAEAIRAGNRVALSKGITLIESENETKRPLAEQLINLLLPFSGKSKRIGITGVPGAGKSTFIEAFGTRLCNEGKTVAVLAIDPTSTLNKGSILGDKTRMEELSRHPNAFIRPSPSSGALGGVARKTRESMFLCEAAGFDIILVETVGVGQSETDVHSMVDLFILLLIAGAGDELQGIKRGIMEMADILVINKDDGDNHAKAQRAQQETRSAIHLFPPTESGWIPQVLTCSSLENKGIEAIWNSIESYYNQLITTGFLDKKRSEQALFWMHQTIREALQFNFYHDPQIKLQLADIEQKVKSGQLNSFDAAHKLLAIFKK